MQISLEWLKDYLKINQTVENIRNLLTFSGIEVENHFIYGELPESVITAKITECEPLSGSDHLKICQVDTGKERIQVVCGAPNCAKGAIGVLALEGTKLTTLEVKKAKIRGVDSLGMLCSEKELGLSDNHSGIIILPENTELGVSFKHLFNLPDDIFELEITPNRPDLLGYQGLATDLCASSDSILKIPEQPDLTNKENPAMPIGNYLNLENQASDLCPRYVARVIQNVKINESPLWLKLRLIKSGLRPINNVVDVTNYIMLETGHPLHAFDYHSLLGKQGKPSIVVRRAKDKEMFPALNGEVYTLNTNNLVIADSEKPVALAGIIGGLNSHITEQTTAIVLEAACFKASSIRKTAYEHKLSTDSSYRFERHLSPATCEYASTRAIDMILKLAGGELCKGSLDDWREKQEALIVTLRPKRIEKVLNISLENSIIINYLSKLGLSYLGNGTAGEDFNTSSNKEPLEETLLFKIPPKRIDLTREIDLIEEIARLYGMDNIPQTSSCPAIMDRHAFKIKRKCCDFLSQHGLYEIVNLSFTDPNQIKKLNLEENDIRLRQIELLNPQNKTFSVMRTSLLPQLINTALYNINHGTKQLKIYELNKVYFENNSLPKIESLQLSILLTGNRYGLSWREKAQPIDFYDLKGLITSLLEDLGLEQIENSDKVSGYFLSGEAQSIFYQGKMICEYGKLTPSIAASFELDVAELKQDIWLADLNLNAIIEITRNMLRKYHEIPRLPVIERDISFTINKAIQHSQILDCFNSIGLKSIYDVILIDEYVGKQIADGKRSLTYRIVFYNPEKTLTDDEVDAEFDFIVKTLKSKWDIELR